MNNLNEVFNRKLLSEELPKVIKFQIISWYVSDFEIIYNEEQIQEEEEKLELIFYLSGVNEKGQTVTLRISDFMPYFYVQLPDNTNYIEAKKFFEYIKKRMWNMSYSLVSFSLEEKKKLYPYLAEKKFKFIRLNFSSDKGFKKCKYLFSEQNQIDKPIKILGFPNMMYEAFETNVEHINRLCHAKKIQTTGWIKVKNFEEEQEYSSSQINISASYLNIFADNETTDISPLTIFSWDIECLPKNTEEFPNPDFPEDVISQIGIVLQKYGTNISQKFIFVDKNCDPINDATVIVSKNEKQLLEKFCYFFKKVDPDMIVGYNTWGFDDKYLWKRLMYHEIDTSCFSRINDANPTLKKKELSSSAYGNNEYNYILCPGRETFDLIEGIRRENKLESYSLNAVGKHFLKESKIDLPYRELFEKLSKGNSKDIAECAEYCIQDSNLVLRLLLKLNFIPNYIEMAKATYVPQEWLLFRGQQCKVFSLIVKKAMENDFVIPVNKQNGQYKFKGATVLTAHKGIHYDAVAGLDFASLYPSIMIAYNLCYSTFIENEEMLEYVKKNNIPYKTIMWEEEDEDNENYVEGSVDNIKKKYSFSFVQIEDDKGKELPKGVRGQLSTILNELWQGRKETKKMMKKEKDEFKYAILNGKQLAQKVTMNSVYGFTGASNGIFPCKPIAACTTAKGRQIIEQTANIAKEAYGAFVIYGDSIPPYQLITYKKDDKIEEENIESFSEKLFQPWEDYRGFKINDININNKKYKNLEGSNLLAYTHKGFQPIKKIIKHDSQKKLYKICARDNNGNIHTVVVTEGHSLIDKNGNLLTAETAQIGDELFEY